MGFTATGKLTFSHVKGGVILKETTFEIKDFTARKNIASFNK